MTRPRRRGPVNVIRGLGGPIQKPQPSGTRPLGAVLYARPGPAPRFPALPSEPRNEVRGPYRQSVRGFLSVRMRQVESVEPNSAGPAALGRLLEAGHGEPALPMGHYGGSRKAGRHPQVEPAEDRRFLPRLHG